LAPRKLAARNLADAHFNVLEKSAAARVAIIRPSFSMAAAILYAFGMRIETSGSYTASTSTLGNRRGVAMVVAVRGGRHGARTLIVFDPAPMARRELSPLFWYSAAAIGACDGLHATSVSHTIASRRASDRHLSCSQTGSPFVSQPSYETISNMKHDCEPNEWTTHPKFCNEHWVIHGPMPGEPKGWGFAERCSATDAFRAINDRLPDPGFPYYE
jgi:hypothetical protein